MYAGLFGYLLIGAVVSGYVELTWQDNADYRTGMLSVFFVDAVYWFMLFFSRHVIVTCRHRTTVLDLALIVPFISLVPVCVFAGGVASPLTYILTLPIIFLSIAYPQRSVWLNGAIVLLCYVAVAALSPQPMPLMTVLVQLAVLIDSFLLASLGARFRDLRNRELGVLRLRLETLANTDDLTGCLNQRAFSQALTDRLDQAVRQCRPLALLIIDIDHFKQINDRHGHLVGDEVLRRVGKILRDSARDRDVVGRPGGDELGVLSPDETREGARKLAERIRRQIKADSLPMDVTLSIGISISRVDDPDDPNALFRRADLALYQAKRRGRDRFIDDSELERDEIGYYELGRVVKR